jgi:hypothetical protein
MARRMASRAHPLLAVRSLGLRLRGNSCAVLAGLALRDVSPVSQRQPSCAGAGGVLHTSCYVRTNSTSCPEIGALLFSALDYRLLLRRG